MNATSDYLARLDAALREVPHGIASEIRAGIAEELASLEPDAVRVRIAQLGDPERIAREAMDAVMPARTDPVPPPVVARPPLTRTRGFAIAAAIALGVGGLVVPFAGWLAGAAMVMMSAMWRTGEKLVALLPPFAAAALMALASAVSAWLDGGGEQAGTVVVNPLLPAAYDFMHAGFLLIPFVVVPVSGFWLLWRLRGRSTD